MKATIQNQPEPQFLRGTAAVAARLGVHERTVSRWMRCHILPYTKMGSAVLFRVSDLEEVLNRHTVPSVSGVGGGRMHGARAVRRAAAEGGAL